MGACSESCTSLRQPMTREATERTASRPAGGGGRTRVSRGGEGLHQARSDDGKKEEDDETPHLHAAYKPLRRKSPCVDAVRIFHLNIFLCLRLQLGSRVTDRAPGRSRESFFFRGGKDVACSRNIFGTHTRTALWLPSFSRGATVRRLESHAETLWSAGNDTRTLSTATGSTQLAGFFFSGLGREG